MNNVEQATRIQHLKAEYQGGPQFVLLGWQIKTADDIERPVAVVPEPIGGIKDKNGMSPTQKAYARLFVAAPELLEAAVISEDASLIGIAWSNDNMTTVRALMQKYDLGGMEIGSARNVLVTRAGSIRRAAIAKATGAQS